MVMCDMCRECDVCVMRMADGGGRKKKQKVCSPRKGERGRWSREFRSRSRPRPKGRGVPGDWGFLCGILPCRRHRTVASRSGTGSCREGDSIMRLSSVTIGRIFGLVSISYGKGSKGRKGRQQAGKRVREGSRALGAMWRDGVE